MDTTPTLLTLPAELRVSIWEYASIEPDTITVTESLKLPALLSVNRQVRNETCRLWFSKNSFLFNVIDCDDDIYLKFGRTVYKGLPNVRIPHSRQLLGEPNWQNLMRSCKRVHQMQVVPMTTLKLNEEENELAAVIAAAHEIARPAGKKGEGWEQVERALGALRKVAVFADRRWIEG